MDEAAGGALQLSAARGGVTGQGGRTARAPDKIRASSARAAARRETARGRASPSFRTWLDFCHSPGPSPPLRTGNEVSK
jgi:hypothetical protein